VLAWLLLGAAAPTLAAQMVAASSIADLSRLSIEELADIEISSVSKKAEPLADAAAAIYVITNDDIRRSGATSLPEALRLAPNLQVARVDASRYAITARGFNSSISTNKLLVLIDGRTVYSPINATVFWDAQEVMLEDVERIEVISGAGGTLWGSNAVNGVINISTKSSKDTQGTLVSAGAGSDERDLAARYGARVGEDASFRLYGKGFDRNHTDTATGNSRQDAARKVQGGFRFDWAHASDALTLQGDAYNGVTEQPNLASTSLSGGNLLGRWNRTLESGGTLQVQAYYDRAKRVTPGTFADALDTYDVDAQHGFKLGDSHDILWGGGYRLMRDQTEKSALLEFVPADRDMRLSNLFIQDTITLSERLKLTLGEKLEHNSYTGLESQPSARLAWKLDQHNLLWSSISRAVRTPQRIDTDFHVFLPILPLQVNPNFVSERLTAYELGYRAQPSPKLSYSVSVFYNVYDRLRSIEQAANGTITLGNNIEGHTAGVELWGNYQATEMWRLSAGFNALRERLHFTSQHVASALPAASGGATQTSGNDPARQFQLRSSLNLPHGLEFDTTLRAVSALPNPAVPGYVTLDARLGWHASKSLELSVTGSNLLGHGHQEFGTPPRSEIGRSVFVNLLWKN
jgi:iron complex outermembrane receptor protein